MAHAIMFWEILPTPQSQRFFPRSFIALGFTLKTVIQLEIIFVFGVK